MRCRSHGKEFIGLCTWCGAQLCERCIGSQDGKKLYCSGCAARLQTLPKREAPAESRLKRPHLTTGLEDDEEQPRIEIIKE